MAAAFKALALGLAILCFSISSGAQMLCGPPTVIRKMLEDRFGEIPAGAGLVGNRIVELLLSRSGSWTILATDPEGLSCVVTGGEDWVAAARRPEGGDAPPEDAATKDRGI